MMSDTSVLIVTGRPHRGFSFPPGARRGGRWQHSGFLRLPDESGRLHDCGSRFPRSTASVVQRTGQRGEAPHPPSNQYDANSFSAAVEMISYICRVNVIFISAFDSTVVHHTAALCERHSDLCK